MLLLCVPVGNANEKPHAQSTHGLGFIPCFLRLGSRIGDPPSRAPNRSSIAVRAAEAQRRSLPSIAPRLAGLMGFPAQTPMGNADLALPCPAEFAQARAVVFQDAGLWSQLRYTSWLCTCPPGRPCHRAWRHPQGRAGCCPCRTRPGRRNRWRHGRCWCCS